ncbi:uncharacterized protein DEA37_0002941 [Paragonimus westermani]|uniref:Dynein regulatory complex protein 9 n=1 Tax=Paragonimus westermani TaxID=34504 RepID=A0A5J4N9T2_9TREM|nr:uncharacterized protein DEA37_0002941 [Paragonimus westermani]
MTVYFCHNFLRERESRAKIKELRSEIERQTKEGIQLVEQSKETIAHLKDQVQEMKAKAIMEEKYVTRYSTVRLEELQSQCDAEEQELRDEIKRISLMQDQESRVTEETRSYLHDRLSELNQKQEYWQERCQKNIEELRHKLEVLKAGKTKDLTRLHDLTIQYQEYEAVVLADRISKEKARQQAELMGMQEDASLKIQNWWRCQLVRYGLGPYAKKKKGKGKKSKAGKKVKK